ncbi:MAG: hypothetical protein K2Q06_05330, partial [Parvularculaceae bacterium]|nr:hypothetical protein [Parvularculaceae bacterium]
MSKSDFALHPLRAAVLALVVFAAACTGGGESAVDSTLPAAAQSVVDKPPTPIKGIRSPRCSWRRASTMVALA